VLLGLAVLQPSSKGAGIKFSGGKMDDFGPSEAVDRARELGKELEKKK
jgi:hypothetical protein